MFKKLRFEYSTYLDHKKNCAVEMTMLDGNTVIVTSDVYMHHYEEKLNNEDSYDIIRQIDEIALETWQDEYHPEGYLVMDGYSWEVELEETDPYRKTVKRGNNAYPWCFYKLLGLLIDYTDVEVGMILGPHVRQMECFYDPMEGKPYDLDEGKIVGYLKDHIGKRISSCRLINDAGAYIGEEIEPDYFELHRQLFIIADANGFLLDMSDHDGKCEGLPYNLDFRIIR